MSEKAGASFVLELSLVVTRLDARVLSTSLEAGRQVYNAARCEACGVSTSSSNPRRGKPRGK
jgi:hypothetical protein